MSRSHSHTPWSALRKQRDNPCLHRQMRHTALPHTVFFIVFLVILAGSILVTACTDDGSSTNHSTTGPGQSLTFTTEDGITLEGHLFGSGNTGIVLAHMYPADQTSWYTTAERLAGRGYLVLTFDFRGYGESGGEKEIAHLDRDVFAAILAIAEAGASRITLVGASMGGTACLIAADSSQILSSVLVTGVTTLSAPLDFKGLDATEAVSRLRMPLLFIAAEDDSGAEGARQLQELTGNTGDLQIVPGDDHGTDLLGGSSQEQVWTLLTTFIEQTLPVTSP